MRLFYWLRSHRDSVSIQRRAQRPRWLGRVEELEGRALPNDCLLSLRHGTNVLGNMGIHAPPEQPDAQASARLDQPEPDANMMDSFGLLLAFPFGRAPSALSELLMHNHVGNASNDGPARASTDEPLAHNFPAPLGSVYSGPSVATTVPERAGSAIVANAAALLTSVQPVPTAVQRGVARHGLSGLSRSRTKSLTEPGPREANNPSHALVGYWHNFRNGAGPLRLRDVASDFAVINIAFAETRGGSTSQIQFAVDTSIESDAAFRDDVAYLQGQGKSVVLSIGGANAFVQLNTPADLSNFVQSVSGIVSSYGFDGIDIDFEGSSVHLNPGDTDFTNPTTPLIVNLNSALHQLNTQFGPQFIIGMAPETFFVQTGFDAYGGAAGAYLPIIYGSQDVLTFLYVQGYNSGSMRGLDGRVYSQGTADFHVAMTEMLLQGFPVAGGRFGLFPGLAGQQIAFGVPASPQAGGGFTSIPDLQNALRYLIEGIPFGGTYQLVNPGGYPDMLGLMTWSINWDRFYGFQLSSTIGPYLHGFP
jgi:chitinase